MYSRTERTLLNILVCANAAPSFLRVLAAEIGRGGHGRRWTGKCNTTADCNDTGLTCIKYGNDTPQVMLCVSCDEFWGGLTCPPKPVEPGFPWWILILIIVLLVLLTAIICYFVNPCPIYKMRKKKEMEKQQMEELKKKKKNTGVGQKKGGQGPTDDLFPTVTKESISRDPSKPTSSAKTPRASGTADAPGAAATDAAGEEEKPPKKGSKPSKPSKASKSSKASKKPSKASKDTKGSKGSKGSKKK